ncbi:nicotinate-nucleotide--dimethylbenzimidazole phosphoribosyltransferase [Acetobacter sp. TBRC 12305]|uniref:Nicotinate-nucleotide--dimethylbenzimidazole phosphoribosyltransferase n=1 Tax=Acetobacter garciniae TaxID=2817435 RepID=A0A939HKN5_9PROT|nr:nicotinate-nucleotide--dimethylbenzimidazole phosphoribosyltransferase [Acetobacter garciniae]MBO1325247.1 nicotinate-nucleotide--dimethylbenzimidazole phosphoribosyltransferase [Acetobacter garciniae]MBX0344781.1 nicotinate-nucleotide--dimethylbenzimidazole phosphoribosyltransferase [Acetobacter garciniae]
MDTHSTAQHPHTLPAAPICMEELRALCVALPQADTNAQDAIAAREATLCKPAGSLGRLEDLTRWLGGWQRRATPRLEHVHVLIFAGNHGVAARGVSPWPTEVTAQMLATFAQGRAAINQIARSVGAELKAVPVHALAPTADFTTRPAMTEAAFVAAVATGFNSVPAQCDLLCLGEMGIGNTTAASALAAALSANGAPDMTLTPGQNWAGRGTGLDDAGLSHKARMIDAALACHGPALGLKVGLEHAVNQPVADGLSPTSARSTPDPLEAARRLGGYELAALLGATLAARHRNIPVLLDGFVCLAATAPLTLLAPGGLAHACLSHCATQTGQTRRLADFLGMEPLLGLGLRLGEGSGATLAVPLLRAALACHTGMATFEQAAILRQT